MSRLARAALLLVLGSVPGRAQKWERLGPPGGDVISLAVGGDGTVYLGTPDGHVFASQDAALHWELRGRAEDRFDGVVQQLIVDARKPQRLFAAVWNQDPAAGGGIFCSEDGGRTWALAGLGGEAVRALQQAPSNAEIFVAGTRTGVFGSEDGGRNWKRISPAGDTELRNVDSLAIDPRDAQRIYVGTYHLPWKTEDGGKTWAAIAAGMIDDSDIMSLCIDEENSARVYASACSGIYRSENGGASWTKLQGVPYAARRTQAIVQDPGDARSLYAATTEGLWVTCDAGESWKRTTPREWVINGALVIPKTARGGARVVLGTESQGVLVSEDGGETFAAANQGFAHAVMQDLLADPRRPQQLLALTAREGGTLLESQDAGSTWTKRETREMQGKLGKMYGTPWGWFAALKSGGLARLNEEEHRWVGVPLRLSVAPGSRATRGQGRVKPSRTRPTNDVVRGLWYSEEFLYLATSAGALRCSPAGACQSLEGFGAKRGVQAIWAATDDRQVLAGLGGKVGFSGDGGKTAVWKLIRSPALGIYWIRVRGEAAVTVILAGTTEGVFQSRDTGDTWTLVQSGLPAAQAEGVLWTPDLLAVSMRSGGLYVSWDQGANWTRADHGSVLSRFTGLTEPAPGMLLVASQSEGILRVEWEKTGKE